MKRVIEAEFFPLNSDYDVSPSVSVSDSAVTEKRRILIVDNNRDSTRLVKILLERASDYLVVEENARGDSRCDAIQNTGTIETSTIKL